MQRLHQCAAVIGPVVDANSPIGCGSAQSTSKAAFNAIQLIGSMEADCRDSVFLGFLSCLLGIWLSAWLILLLLLPFPIRITF